jgi:hypothetical protein
MNETKQTVSNEPQEADPVGLRVSELKDPLGKREVGSRYRDNLKRLDGFEADPLGRNVARLKGGARQDVHGSVGPDRPRSTTNGEEVPAAGEPRFLRSQARVPATNRPPGVGDGEEHGPERVGSSEDCAYGPVSGG